MSEELGADFLRALGDDKPKAEVGADFLEALGQAPAAPAAQPEFKSGIAPPMFTAREMAAESRAHLQQKADRWKGLPTTAALFQESAEGKSKNFLQTLGDAAGTLRKFWDVGMAGQAAQGRTGVASAIGAGSDVMRDVQTAGRVAQAAPGLRERVSPERALAMQQQGNTMGGRLASTAGALAVDLPLFAATGPLGRFPLIGRALQFGAVGAATAPPEDRVGGGLGGATFGMGLQFFGLLGRTALGVPAAKKMLAETGKGAIGLAAREGAAGLTSFEAAGLVTEFAATGKIHMTPEQFAENAILWAAFESAGLVRIAKSGRGQPVAIETTKVGEVLRAQAMEGRGEVVPPGGGAAPEGPGRMGEVVPGRRQAAFPEYEAPIPGQLGPRSREALVDTQRARQEARGQRERAEAAAEEFSRAQGSSGARGNRPAESAIGQTSAVADTPVNRMADTAPNLRMLANGWAVEGRSQSMTFRERADAERAAGLPDAEAWTLYHNQFRRPYEGVSEGVVRAKIVNNQPLTAGERAWIDARKQPAETASSPQKQPVDFPTSVKEAAQKAEQFGGNAWISSVYEVWAKDNPGVTLEQFKARLVENRAGMGLQRSDLGPELVESGQVSRERYESSRTPDTGIDWHMIRVGGGKKQESVPGEFSDADVSSIAAGVRGGQARKGGKERGAADIGTLAAVPFEAAGAPATVTGKILDAADAGVRAAVSSAWRGALAERGRSAVRGAGKRIKEVLAEWTPQRVKDAGQAAWRARPHLAGREARSTMAEYDRKASLGRYVARRNLRDLSRGQDGKPLSDAQKDLAVRYREGGATREEAVSALGHDYVRRLDKAYAEIDANQRALRDIEWLSPETLKEWEGRWLPRLYTSKEASRKGSVPPPRTSAKKLAPIHMRRDKWTVLWREGGRVKRQKFESEGEARDFETNLKNDRDIQGRRGKRSGLRDIRTVQGKQVGQVSKAPKRKKLGEIEVVSPLTKEQREYLGEVRDPAILTARAQIQQRGVLAVADLLNRVSRNPKFARKDPHPDFHPEPVPADPKRYGSLAGQYVHKSIKADVLGVLREPATFLDHIAGFSDTILSQWKWGKTAGNPGTHGRNILSNAYFSYMTGNSYFNPANLRHFAEAIRIIGRGDKTTEFLIREGLYGSDYLSSELPKLAQEMGRYRGASAGEKMLNYVKDKAGGLAKGRVFTSLPGAETASKLYQMEDVLPKVAAWVKKVRAGKDPREAAAEVRRDFPQYDEAATMSYMRRKTPGAALSRQVTPPFLTFTVEAARIIGRNVVTRPVRSMVMLAALEAARVTLAESAGLSEEELERATAAAPEYRRPGIFNWVLPWRDDKGELQVYDLTYTFPLGEQIQGARAWLSGDSEFPEERIGAMSLPIGPFLSLAIQLGTNRSWFTGRNINRARGEGEFVATSEEQGVRDTWAFAAQQMLPSLFPGGYNWKKINEAIDQVPVDLEGERTRPVLTTLLDTMAGIKVRSFDPDRDAAMRIRRIEDLMRKKLSRVSSLARQPENYRGMRERDRRREYDELQADILRLYNETLRLRGMSSLPDNGVALPPDVQAVFDEKMRPSEPRRRLPGSLLGLPDSERREMGEALGIDAPDGGNRRSRRTQRSRRTRR